MDMDEESRQKNRCNLVCHGIKQPFRLGGGILIDPRLAGLAGPPLSWLNSFARVWHAWRDGGWIYRDFTLEVGTDAVGAWRKGFTAVLYPRLVFKLTPASTDTVYTTEEIRAFRQVPDYTSQFVQEFNLGLLWQNLLFLKVKLSVAHWKYPFITPSAPVIPPEKV